MKTKFLFLIAFTLLVEAHCNVPLHANDIDTVWMSKTDQQLGFFMVKFSKNDSIIVGHGLDNDLFFHAISGEEYMRISGSNEVFFFENDTRFLRINEQGSKIEIFDTKTGLVLDTLEHDGTKIYPIAGISDDERFFVAIIQGGFKIWDVITKSVFKTKYFISEVNLSIFNIDQIKFTCDNQKLICTEYKEYFDPKNPQGGKYTTLNHTIYDFNSLDSIDAFLGMAYFRLSNTCTKIAFKRSDPNFGVEVYDFNTKELLWKLPINGPSLTGLEFSPDDRYLVTSSGPGTNALKIWNLNTKLEIYNYFYAGYTALDVSHDGNNIIADNAGYLVLYVSRWQGILVEEDEENPIVIYPNPTNGMAIINYFQSMPEITTINLSDINGIFLGELYNNFLEPGHQNIDIDVNDLPNGSYFINVNNSQLSLTFKLIVNK